jgi:hypothetical protein
MAVRWLLDIPVKTILVCWLGAKELNDYLDRIINSNILAEPLFGYGRVIEAIIYYDKEKSLYR